MDAHTGHPSTVIEHSGMVQPLPETPPACPGHQIPCAKRTVRKEGRNNGRLFWACSLPISQQCRFFQWADEGNGKREREMETETSKEPVPPSLRADYDTAPRLNSPPKKRRVLPDWMLGYDGVMKKREEEFTDFHRQKNAFRQAALSTIGDSSSTTLIGHVDESIFTEGRVVVFDLETTGFSADDGICEIGAVELVDGERTGSLFHSYARPVALVNPFAYRAHHLSDDFLLLQPPIQIVLDNFVAWLGAPCALVAHNMNFDARMLRQELKRWGLHIAVNASEAGEDTEEDHTEQGSWEECRVLSYDVDASTPNGCGEAIEVERESSLEVERKEARDAALDQEGGIYVNLVCTMQMFRRCFPGKRFSLDAVRQELQLASHLHRFTHGALLDAEITAEVYQYFLERGSIFRR